MTRPKGTASRSSSHRASRPTAAAPRSLARSRSAWIAREPWIAASLLALHLALVIWGAARNSVTFDENFHLPSGVLVVAKGDLGVSSVNPHLVKALCAVPALLAGAKLPTPEAVATRNQAVVGESFMRVNADRYHRVYFAARMVIALLSVGLGALVWRFARRIYGVPAGLLALGFYALAPEALAHGGVVTMDIASSLGVLGTLYPFWIFCRTGRWRAWAWAALALGLMALTRFTALQLYAVLAGTTLLFTFTGHVHRPRRVWLGYVLLAPVTLVILQIGYLGHTSFEPLSEWPLFSNHLLALKKAVPWLRVPFPDDYFAGFDWVAFEGQPGKTPTYLLGNIYLGRVWMYFPLALLCKWPLGFLGALLARAVMALRRRGRSRHEVFLLVPALGVLAGGMFLVTINAGVRYMLPILPLLCIWLGGLWSTRRANAAPARLPSRSRRRLAPAIAVALLALQTVEVASCAPWYLAFFNWPSGGTGGGFRLVNDSNVDWGQGLIALRDEMTKRGIGRIHLTYHGTTDPAVYGIDYAPYFGGQPGPESDWIAISSYYFVGLGQRMMTSRGRTRTLRIDFHNLWGVPPEAVPAGCMYLYRVRPTGTAAPPPPR